MALSLSSHWESSCHDLMAADVTGPGSSMLAFVMQWTPLFHGILLSTQGSPCALNSSLSTLLLDLR